MSDIPEVSALDQHLGYWMRLVSNHVSHAFSRKLEAHGVTVAEWVILRELFTQKEASPSALAESLGLTRGAVSKLIERLVAKSLVERTTEESDKRYQRLTLTASGRLMVPELAQLADQNDAEFFGHLSPQQQQNLLSQLKELVTKHQLKDTPLD